MKSITKIFICNVLMLSLAFSLLCGTAYAETTETDQTKQISIKEYENAMSQIYAQCGREWKIIDSSNAKPITKEIFDSEIERAKKEVAEYQAAYKAEEIYSATLTKTQVTGIHINSIMPVTKNVSTSTSASYGVFCNAVIIASANITYNADNGNIMSVNSQSIYQGTSVNLDAWVDEGSYITNNGTFLYANFRGKCYFSYTIPVINVKVSDTVTVFAGSGLN
ncbi:hypothetical protein [Anaerocolumna jejuensis]|uniref:hypothetical protein n=1 Tax=Anaerocolumna jejuensis TaxID=259063 RepID=UPI003F7C478E